MIALIGAGPLGLEMAIALKRSGLEYIHFEAGPIGSTMAWWAPGTRWFSSNDRISIAGVPLVTPTQEKATREEYLAYLRTIVQQFHLAVHTFTRVTAIERIAGGRFRLQTRHALIESAPVQSLEAEKIILVTGGTASPNLLGIPGEDLPHVSHYFYDPHRYFGKRLLIVGGRNSAVEAALRCHRAGAQVHFSYRGAGVDAKDIKYWLYPEFSSLVKAGKIHAHFQTVVTQITPTHVALAGSGDASPNPQNLEMDFVLLLTGYRADMSLAAMAGVTLNGEQQTPTYNPQTMETNIPGLYVAGTTIAGTQRRYRVFLENCHGHVAGVVAHLTGTPPPSDTQTAFERPES
jgi:thioredoxin reductase (NADPH)